MKLLLALLILALASCAANPPFNSAVYTWPKNATPAQTQTRIALSTSQTTPETTTIHTRIIQRGTPRPQNITLPAKVDLNTIGLTWINDSRFFITSDTTPIIDYQKKGTLWYAKPLNRQTRP